MHEWLGCGVVGLTDIVGTDVIIAVGWLGGLRRAASEAATPTVGAIVGRVCCPQAEQVSAILTVVYAVLKEHLKYKDDV